MKKSPKSDSNQSGRLREAAKKAGADDAEAFDRAFKKVVVPPKKNTKKSAKR
jgi:hypothetical protein